MPVPGETMFSDEWMNRNSDRRIPVPFRKMCRDVCKDHSLGNDNSMEMVWLTLSPHIKQVAQTVYKEAAEEWGSEEDLYHPDGGLLSVDESMEMYGEDFVNPPFDVYGN